MASIYKRGKTWWVKFHLKGIPVQQSLNTTHERVAQARRSQIEYKLGTGTLVMPSETPIGDFLEGFCQYLRGTRTRKSYKNEAGDSDTNSSQPATDKQKQFMKKLGIKFPATVTKQEASMMIDEELGRSSE